MPYDALSDLPDAVKKLPKHAQEIYLSAFNNAFEQYNGDEAKSAATAWAAVKTKYEQDANGNWKAKEARMLSDKEKQSMLQAALVAEYGLKVEIPKPQSLTIEEVFSDRLIYNIDGQLYEAPYELVNNEPKFGDPKKVTSTKIFTRESLQEAYSEIIQEAGKRNALKDADRVKKILALCQELLSNDEADEKKVNAASKEAAKVLTWIKTLEAEKTEDGVQFPATAYAYVPEADTPSGWKLRMWGDSDKKVTRAQLGRAAASFSPGGFRGQKVAIPEADLAAVKRKIRVEYRKLDVGEDDIPRWVKETMSREEIINFVPFTEATDLSDKGIANVIVIKPGFNADKSRYYPTEMLKRDYKVFEGQKMHADHPTEEEDKALPERSVKSGGWVSSLHNVICDENGVITGKANIIEDWMMRKLANLRDKKMLHEMGISINAIGRASKATIEGVETLVIEELTGCRSVDFVTEPGAGGIVTFYESDRSRDVDLVELSELKERRPDLIKAIESGVRNEIAKEVKTAMEHEEEIKGKDETIEALTKERDELKEAAEKAIQEKAQADAQAAIKEAVDKAELPQASKDVLLARFESAVTAEGIEEAIKSEIDYIAKLSEAGKVKNFGPSQPEKEAATKALRESFKASHPEWSDEQVETAVTGR